MHEFEKRAPGQQVAKLGNKEFLVEKCLGRGGVNVVYKVSGQHEGKTVEFALRMPKEPSRGGRFSSAFFAPNKLDIDPHLPHVTVPSRSHSGMVTFETGEVIPAYVTKLFDSDLHQRRTARTPATFSIPEATHYLTQAVLGLDLVDRAHLDIKPANLLVKDTYLAVADWDFSLPIGQVQPHYRGTPNYSAPEQHKANFIADKRADVFALGVIGCEMLLGHNPHLKRSYEEASQYSGSPDSQLFSAFAHCSTPYTTEKDDLYDQIMVNATAPDPSQRSTMREMLLNLCAYPHVHSLIPEDKRAELAKELIQRDTLDLRTPDLDYHAAIYLAKGLHNPAHAELRKEIQTFADEVADNYGVTLSNTPIFALPGHDGQKATIPSDFLRGEVSTHVRGVAIMKPSDAKHAYAQTASYATQWREATTLNAYSPEQAKAIQAVAGLPHLQTSDTGHKATAKYIASVIDADWDSFRKLDAPNGLMHVRIHSADKWIDQGSVIIAKDGLAKEGLWVMTDQQDRVRAIAHYQQDRLHGAYQYFDGNGRPAISGTYDNGHKQGPFITYRDGIPHETIVYEQGLAQPVTPAQNPQKRPSTTQSMSH